MQNNKKILENLQKSLELHKQSMAVAMSSIRSQLKGTKEGEMIEKELITLTNLDAIKGGVDVSGEVAKSIERLNKMLNDFGNK